MTRSLTTSCATALILLASAAAWAQQDDLEARSRVQIQSEHLVIDTQGQTATFDGDVVVRHGQLHLRCEHLLADLDDDGKPTRITATGRVKISHGELFATAGTVVYHQDTRKLLLTDSPVLWRGKSRVAGEAVRIDLAHDSVEVDKPRGSLALPPPATASTPREQP